MDKSGVCRVRCQKNWGQRASEGGTQDKETSGHGLSAASSVEKKG